MEGYFWRFTAPPGDGRVYRALRENRADDGTWSTLGLAAHPNGFLRAVEHPEGWADPDRFGALRGAGVRRAADSLHVDLGPDAGLDVAIADGVPWGRRPFGGSSVFQSSRPSTSTGTPGCSAAAPTGPPGVGGEEWSWTAGGSTRRRTGAGGGFPD